MSMRSSDAKAKADFNKHAFSFKAEYYKTGKRTIHYVVTGKDSFPTLVFIHGSPGKWDSFEKYLKDSALQHHYRMVSVDRPGFGYSNGKGLNLTAQASLLSQVLEKIQNGKSICLIGYSFGGPLAVKLAAQNPSLPITNLVTLAGAADPAEEKPESWRITLDRTPLRYLIPGEMRASNAELVLFKYDVEETPEDLENVTCRVLIMQGKKDDIVPPGNALFAQKNLTHAKEVKLVWFEDEQHHLPWTKFKDIRDALLQLNMSS